jgi:hypothetical protein
VTPTLQGEGLGVRIIYGNHNLECLGMKVYSPIDRSIPIESIFHYLIEETDVA